MPSDMKESGGGGTYEITPLVALLAANARYWSNIAPIVRGELARWRAPAEAIEDPKLGELALEKLSEERFNAEVAATLATLAPRHTRASAVRAIVALELLFDYLDGRTELPSDDPLGEGMRLFGAFTSAVEPAGHEQLLSPGAPTLAADRSEEAYMLALGAQVRENLLCLPAASQVAETARGSVVRCAQAQTRLHAASTLGDRSLEEWAEAPARAAGLGWREYVGGSAASVLCTHALIAAAADPATTAADAARIDAAYLAIGGVITMLDSLVDHSSDTARGEAGFIRLFETDELEQAVGNLTREALSRAREAPHAAHHVMTLAGAAAYYTTHRGARDPHARSIVAMLRRELSPTVWPGVLVLRSWRLAKSLHAGLRRTTASDTEQSRGPNGTPRSGAFGETAT